MNGFTYCTKCKKWSYIPKDFDERHHFVTCQCGQIMCLQRRLDPIRDLAYRLSDRVEGKICNQ